MHKERKTTCLFRINRTKTAYHSMDFFRIPRINEDSSSVQKVSSCRKVLTWVLLGLFTSLSTWGQTVRTLRADYVLSGDSANQSISLYALSSFPGWAGRTTHLDSLFLRGNAILTLRDLDSDNILYRQSFSTLFQEWQTTQEATSIRRAFELTLLMPMPAEKAIATIVLYDHRGKVSTTFSHTIDPKDILIRQLDNTPIPPYRNLWTGTSTGNKIDVAIVAEGYTVTQSEDFYAKATEATEAILSHEPFNSLKEHFNFVAVMPASQDSDVSIPLEGIWRNTALDSHFSTFYSDRYLTTPSVWKLHDYLARIPYEHIIILANTHTYGGGGIYNAYTLTTTHHSAFRPVVVHEFGHSFAGLADEYYYDDQYENFYEPGIEPWEPNITTLADFNAKWKDMLAPQTPIPTPSAPSTPNKLGVYEGGGYMSKGVFRARQDCRMKTNTCVDFCPVCQRSIKKLIRFYTE